MWRCAAAHRTLVSQRPPSRRVLVVIGLLLFVLASTAAWAGSRPGIAGRLLPLPIPASSGKTYYVSTTGDDSNRGTFEEPWLTVQHALDTLDFGDTALVRDGTYNENLRATRQGAGVKPITIANYPGERPVLRPAGGPENSYPIAIDSASYHRFQGFVIEGALGPSSANLYLSGGSHHIEISGNEIRSSSDQGIYADRTTHDIQILGNAIHDNGPSPIHQSHGIYLQGVDQLVANNVFYDNHHGYGIHVYPNADRVLIVHNTLVGNGNVETASGGILLGGNEENTVSNTKIVNNVIAFNAAMGIRSFFPEWVVQPEGNEAYSNVGFGNPGGDFSTWQGGGIDYSNGNLVSDPLFVDGEANDFRLGPTSPAVNRALYSWSPDTDFDGITRPRGPMPDSGAFESH